MEELGTEFILLMISFAQKQNMINNPIGIGVVLSILTVIAIIFLLFRLKSLFKKENHWLVVTLSWSAHQ